MLTRHFLTSTERNLVCESKAPITRAPMNWYDRVLPIISGLLRSEKAAIKLSMLKHTLEVSGLTSSAARTKIYMTGAPLHQPATPMSATRAGYEAKRGIRTYEHVLPTQLAHSHHGSLSHNALVGIEPGREPRHVVGSRDEHDERNGLLLWCAFINRKVHHNCQHAVSCSKSSKTTVAPSCTLRCKTWEVS